MRDVSEYFKEFSKLEAIQIWKASGNLHATDPLVNEKPSVSQLDIEKPVMQFAIWMITSFPRLLILLVSACQTPAVAVFIPVPIPATIRPTIIWGTPYEAV